jgi:hypothetical protein
VALLLKMNIDKRIELQKMFGLMKQRKTNGLVQMVEEAKRHGIQKKLHSHFIISYW